MWFYVSFAFSFNECLVSDLWKVHTVFCRSLLEVARQWASALTSMRKPELTLFTNTGTLYSITQVPLLSQIFNKFRSTDGTARIAPAVYTVYLISSYFPRTVGTPQRLQLSYCCPVYKRLSLKNIWRLETRRKASKVTRKLRVCGHKTKTEVMQLYSCVLTRLFYITDRLNDDFPLWTTSQSKNKFGAHSIVVSLAHSIDAVTAFLLTGRT